MKRKVVVMGGIEVAVEKEIDGWMDGWRYVVGRGFGGGEETPR